MKIFTIGLLLCLTACSVAGQKKRTTVGTNPIYQLESRLIGGDKTALLEISEYLDSDKKVVEFLGYHVLETVESEIAKRVIRENCLFTDDEIRITDSTSTKQFADFLKQSNDKITFSKLASAFLITPLEQRKVNFQIRAIARTKNQELQKNKIALLSAEWVKTSHIDSLIKEKNPQSLLFIASEFFKIRNRFNRHYFYGEEFTDLLQYLTGSEIGVENERKKVSWHPDKDYFPESKLNLLIFFSKFYSQYEWDETQSVFVNPHVEINSIGKEEVLFQLLNNEVDSIAVDAFTQLAVCNPTKVRNLADEYEAADMDKNSAIPIFPYRFLKQLVVFTEYCRANKIDFTGSATLQTNIFLLRSDLSFTERRRLEDKLIRTLSLNDITAFEYWALVYEQSWELTYSAGRILDIFYSRNWNDLIGTKEQLDWYLKKAALFDNLGIIGICNSYLNKFINSSNATLAQISSHQSNDFDIMNQVQKVISLNKQEPKSSKGPSLWEGNKNYELKSPERQIAKLIKNIKDSSEVDNAISKILSQITYAQIPASLKAIEEYSFQSPGGKYSFMERDFGFFLAGNFNEREIRNEFLRLHSSLSEYQLYAFYLDKVNVDYTTVDKRLDYDKIFELLKYNVVVAFVGGGGGKQDNEVYLLVKLLELTFKTTLGFPNKLCSSNNLYACNSDERAVAWMNYLVDNNLLRKKHDEPPSFSQE